MQCSGSDFLKLACNTHFSGKPKGAFLDTVLITGTLTNICCESSPRDAYASGFRVVFVVDATAASRDQDHNATLHNIYRSFGDVRPTDEAIALLSVYRV
ncbi:isochorismatase family protein [Ensifer adhaerens]|nr:isochorismatase family protein [Ensifer adhaerens]MBZ7924408.1 isochorismatase family protein [Ensifer adhaerens]